MIRVAAVGDVHFAEDTRGHLLPHWSRLRECADVFLLSGDLTNLGNRAQASALAQELEAVKVPVVAVLGNHDYHAGEPELVRRILERAGVKVLEGESLTLRIGGHTLGIAGAKGFGGGFAGACGHAFGEPEMKSFMWVTERAALELEASLRELHTDYRVALLHYSPVKDTLAGERLEIFPFLGSYRLAEALDRAGADLCIHGHAHNGAQKGLTPRGIPVRNVAMPLIKRPFAVFTLDSETLGQRPRTRVESATETHSVARL
jgi:Icc-related predicted phosphoesterase